MKTILLFLLLLTGSIAMARMTDAPTLRTRIADDNTTLTIQIDQYKNDQFLHYQRVFDVKTMNCIQKEWLKYRVFASQGVTLPIHEMTGLVVLAGGLVVLIATLLIIIHQTRDA